MQFIRKSLNPELSSTNLSWIRPQTLQGIVSLAHSTPAARGW